MIYKFYNKVTWLTLLIISSYILYADDTTLITANLSAKSVNHFNKEVFEFSNRLAYNN